MPKLHLRAADWYEANGSPAMALEHLLNTSEHDRCAQLLTELVLPTYSVGQMSTVQRWLSALGDSSIAAYPPLAVLAGWVAVLTGQTAEAQRWAAVVDAASFDAVPLDGSASFDSARAMLRAVICAGGPEQMMADANFAVDAEPPWSPWRDTALLLQAEALLLAGDVDHAAHRVRGDVRSRRVTSATPTPSSTPNPSSPCSRWIAASGRSAGQHVDVALTTIDEHRMDDYPTSVLAFAAAARLALHRWRPQGGRATAHAGDARTTVMHVRDAVARQYGSGSTWPRCTWRWRTSRPLVTSSVRSTTSCSTDRWAPSATSVAELRELLTSASPAGATGASPLSPAELRLLPYLQTHLTFREIGERLFVSRNTISSEVGSIYRKLGVSSRSDAVEQATAIGLLGG